MGRWLLGVMAVIACIGAAFALSPWPSIWLVRAVFDSGAQEASRKLEPYVPAGIATTTHRYDPADRDAVLDIHCPAEVPAANPVIVWIHGGGFVSGQRSDITNYAKVLAGRGFTVVNLDYTIAPEAHYPGPVRQVNRALAFLDSNAAKLLDGNRRLVLAGDSAGAQLAAQTAAVVTNPDYAEMLGIAPGAVPERLAGVLLYCGVYDISGMGRGGGVLGWFVQSAGWAYSGKRAWREDAAFATMSVGPRVTAAFPPAFVSAGNADPLGPQSVAMASAIADAGVRVETLFFPADYEPALGHEYQFDLDTEAGRTALDASVAWLQSL